MRETVSLMNRMRVVGDAYHPGLSTIEHWTLNMKIALWIAFAVLALLWTGGAAVVAQLVAWSASGLVAGGAAQVGGAVAGVAIPAWLAPWVDAAAWTAIQQAVAGTLAAVSGSLPMLGTAVGWLVPLVWTLWGVGLVVMFVLTVLGHWLIGRSNGGRPSGPSPLPV